VAREVLKALLEEGEANATLAGYAQTLQANMKVRQQRWAVTPYPYGSEFGFDTTGQEEVVVWNLFFGNDSVAGKTVDHVLSYMRSSATWAYNGGARSWGDVGNNGKYLVTFGTGAQDRGQMHYRSGLNMIPLIEWYRGHPDDFFTLEVSAGAMGGQMANIDATGAPSMMWHAVPHVMDFDPHSGDFGLGFFGNALESGAYYVVHPELGPACYLCDFSSAPAGAVTITPRDGYRIAAFLEPLSLYMQAECGVFSSIKFEPAEQKITAVFAADAPCTALRLRLTKTSTARPGTAFAVKGAKLVRGAYELPPAKGAETPLVVTYDKGRVATPPAATAAY